MHSYRYVGLTIALVAGCTGDQSVPCTMDSDCNLSGGGVCTLASTGNQWCAYPDPECPAGFRYSEQSVGDDLSGVCVDGNRFKLTVRVGGNGAGVVSSQPSGLTCESNTCTGTYPAGTPVELFASAASGSFLGWSDECRGRGTCLVTMDQERVVGALFGVPGEALWVSQLGSTSLDSTRGIAVDGQDNVVGVGLFSETMAVAGTNFTSKGGTDAYVVKLSSTGGVLWARQFGGTTLAGPGAPRPTDFAVGVSTDASSNIFVVGQFQGAVDFGGRMLQSTNATAIFILKLDPDGGVVWAQKIDGGPFGTEGRFDGAIAVRGDSVVVVGSFFRPMTVGAITQDSMGAFDDVFVVKFSSVDGQPVWVKRFGGTSNDFGYGVAIDSAENIVVVGNYSGTVDFGGGPRSSTEGKSFLLKLTPEGTHLLSRPLGGAQVSSFHTFAVKVDASDNIATLTQFTGTSDMGCVNRLASAGAVSNILFTKFTQAGACVWNQGFAGGGNNQSATALDVNSAGDLVITGSFCGTISLGGDFLSSASECPASDMFAARYASDGTHLNSVRAGGTGSESGNGIAQSSDGRFFVSGSFDGFAEFGGETRTSLGNSDGFIVGFSPL